MSLSSIFVTYITLIKNIILSNSFHFENEGVFTGADLRNYKEKLPASFDEEKVRLAKISGQSNF